MPDGCIWVLITDGITARICSTAEGMTTRLPMHGLTASEWDCWANGLGLGLPGATPRRAFFRGGKRLFATFLAQFLQQAAQEDADEKLMIVAAPRIAAALNTALAPETRARVIGKMVCDVEDSETPEIFLAELRH
jgi:Protein required for attachment to host cells